MKPMVGPLICLFFVLREFGLVLRVELEASGLLHEVSVLCLLVRVDHLAHEERRFLSGRARGGVRGRLRRFEEAEGGQRGQRAVVRELGVGRVGRRERRVFGVGVSLRARLSAVARGDARPTAASQRRVLRLQLRAHRRREPFFLLSSKINK